MKQFDFKLTKADFDAVLWEVDLASAKEPTCFEFCALLKAKLDEAKANKQTSREHVYALLHAACSLSLELANGKQPFRPAVIFEALRSAAVEDFAPSDHAVLGEIATTIKDPEVRARVCDLVWVICRDFRMARAAIPAYVESAKRLETFPRSRMFVERLRRAVQLTWMVAKSDEGLVKMVTDEVALAISKRVSTEEQWTCADLMRVLLEAETGDSIKFAGDCELIASKAETRSAWSVARVYWQCKADWHRLANQSEEHRLSLMRAAETYVGEGESALKRSTPSHGACVGNLQRAVEALRRLPNTKERVEALHLRILKEQELSMGETTTHSFQTDISGMVKATVAMFKGKPKRDVLIGLAIFGAWPEKEKLRTSAQEIAKESVWSQIVPTVFTTGKGKKIAEKPGGIFQSEDEQALSLKAQMMEQAKWNRGLMVNGGIKPALHVINGDHFILREDLIVLVENNPFIPPGQEGIFLRGLHAGITGDFLVATHLLIPQVENSIRYLLTHYAGDPRTSKLRQDLSQPERDLNELLYNEEVENVLGADLVFTLRALLIEPGFGANIRNNLAHGLMSTDQFVDADAIYAWWLAWRICCMPMLMRLQGGGIQPPAETPNSDTGSSQATEQTQ